MATSYARHMVLDWGMSDRLGFVQYSPDPNREAIFADRDYSQDTARIIDEEVKRLIDAAFADSERILDENWQHVISISEALLEYETLQSDELEALMKGETISRASVSGLLEQEAEGGSSTESTSVEDSDSDDASASGDVLPNPA